MARKPAPTLQPLVLEGDLDVFSIHQQWEKAQALLTPGTSSAEVDLTAIGDLDLSGLQLLCALDRDLKAKGVPFHLAGPKADWKTRFAPLGLARLFDEGGA
jgi:ABC-type transporter Mla MlaB component